VNAVAPPPEGDDRAQPSDGEQVDQHQPAGRAQHAGDLGQAGGLSVQCAKETVLTTRSKLASWYGSRSRPPRRPHPRVATECGPADLEHGRCRVHAGQRHARREPVGKDAQQGTGAAAHIEHGRRAGERRQHHLGGGAHHLRVELRAPVPLIAVSPAVEAVHVPVALRGTS